MGLDEFAIGAEFLCGGRRWRCTDPNVATHVAGPARGEAQRGAGPLTLVRGGKDGA